MINASRKEKGSVRNGTKIRLGGWFSPSMFGRAAVPGVRFRSRRLDGEDAVPPRLNFVPFGSVRWILVKGKPAHADA